MPLLDTGLGAGKRGKTVVKGCTSALLQMKAYMYLYNVTCKLWFIVKASKLLKATRLVREDLERKM